MGTYKMQLVACHRKPERSFFYKGKQFPICSRCTGIILGYLSMPLFLFRIIDVSLWIALLLNVPAFIDGTTQIVGWRLSNNWLRFITGLMCGVGQIGVIAIVGRSLRVFILNLI